MGSDEETTEPSDATSATTAEPAGDDALAGLDDGAFGDLGVVCQPGDGASPSASDPGVTEDSVQIGAPSPAASFQY